MKNVKWLVLAIFLILHFVPALPRTLGLTGAFYIHPAQAQVVALGVEQKSWRIDAQTALYGITLTSGGGQAKVGLAPGSVVSDTKVELTTYASEYFVQHGQNRRVTPIYRIVVQPPAATTSSSGAFPVEIQYHGDDPGKKTLWSWGEDDLWREVPFTRVAQKNSVRAQVPLGTTYLAVFADQTRLEDGLASWYKYKNCLCAASPDYPKGTKLKVTELRSGKTVVVAVNDFGPDRRKHPERVIDLDLAAFKRLTSTRLGLIKVRVEKVD